MDVNWEEDDFIPTDPDKSTTSTTTTTTTTTTKPIEIDDKLKNALIFWNRMRDESNGLYCDGQMLTNTVQCGDLGHHFCWGVHCMNYGQFYLLGAAGWGIIIDVIQAELGLLAMAEARSRILQVCDTAYVDLAFIVEQ